MEQVNHTGMGVVLYSKEVETTGQEVRVKVWIYRGEYDGRA